MTKVSIKPHARVSPVPTTLVTCGDIDDVYNAIAISYTGNLVTTPPLVYIALKPSRFSHPLIKKYGEFVINVPSANLLAITDYCGVVSGADENKFEVAGLTPLRASKVKAPLIDECPVHYECGVANSFLAGQYEIFIAEVIAAEADEEVLTPGGAVDIAALKPLAYCSEGMQYWTLDEKVGLYGFTRGRL